MKSVKSGITFENLSLQRDLANYVRTVIDTIEVYKAAGTPWGKFPLPKNFHQSIEKWVTGIESDESFSEELNNAIQTFRTKVEDLVNARKDKFAHLDYTRGDVNSLISLLKDIYAKAGGKEEEFFPTDEDSPIPFTGENFVRSIEANAEILKTTDYIVTLLPRIKTLLSDVRVKNVIDNTTVQ